MARPLSSGFSAFKQVVDILEGGSAVGYCFRNEIDIEESGHHLSSGFSPLRTWQIYSILEWLGSSAVALVLEERGRYIRVLFYLAEFIWLHVNKEKILT